LKYIREKNKVVLNRFNEILHDTSVNKTNKRKRKKRKLNDEQESDDEGNLFDRKK
jgi:hypothetical protein